MQVFSTPTVQVPSFGTSRTKATPTRAPQPSQGLKADQFVRFGASSEASDNLALEAKTMQTQQVLVAMQREPGGEAIAEILKEWEQRGYDDKELLSALKDQLDHIITCHEAPPETIIKALDAGLQQIVDDALTRHVDYDFEVPALVSYNSERPVSVFEVGRLGSRKFLPKLRELMEHGTAEQRSNAGGAVSWMSTNIQPEIARAAKKLAHEFKGDIALQRVEAEQGFYFSYLQPLAQTGSARATELLAKAWDQVVAETEERGEDYKDHAASSTFKSLLENFMVLLASRAPGAQEMIDARKPLILDILDAQINTTQKRHFMSPYQKQEYVLLEAGLFGETLSDLPSREAPPGYDSDEGRYPWPLESDYNYFTALPKAVEAMNGRGVAGAAELLSELEAGRDAVLIEQLEKPLVGNMVQFRDEPSPTNEFRDYPFRQLLKIVRADGSPAVLPMLQRLLDEPWRHMERPEWTSGGRPSYTEDKTDAIRRKLAPEIQEAMDDVRVRNGLI